MKKSIFAVAMLAVLGASAAQADETVTVNVKFTGKVLEQACKVTVGNTGNTVDLGTIDNDDNTVGALTPVPFTFNGCPNAVKLQSVELVKDLSVVGPSNAAPDYNQGLLSTNLKNVKVKLSTNPNTAEFTQAKIDLSGKNVTVDNGQFYVPLYAQLQVTGGPGDVGSAEALAQFAVTYQ